MQKLAYTVVSGFTLIFFRYIIAVIIYLIIYRKRPRPELSKQQKKYIVFVGIMGYMVANGLQLVGTSYTDAAMASIINTITPVAIIIFAVLILHEKSSALKLAGVGVTIVGAVVIVGAADGESSFLGVMLNIIGMPMWGWSSVMIRKLCSDIDAVWFTIYANIVAMVCSVPVMGVEIAVRGIEWSSVSLLAVAAIIWLGVIPTAGANLWWNKALEKLPAATCSLFYAFLPLSTTILGVIMLGEGITLNFVIGSIIIILGVIIAIIGEKETKK